MTAGDVPADATLPGGVERRDFGDGETLATKGAVVGPEATDGEWRAWDASRSKLAATYAVGLDPGLEAGSTVLYLGAAAGTTASHVADVAGPTYAVEFAPRPVRDLCRVADDRDRLFPLLADARRPESYAHVVEGDCDLLVQDVATRGQADVALRNRRYLADDGRLALAIKARSEDVTGDPSDVFDAVLDDLRDGYEVLATASLEPYHEDHLAVVARPR
ncbi:fibrillarin-like rRNA/tRNA 2'-O-methyltransferase [Halorubellus sp. PRR65]|uniref:fibrillarin-like rRNA/tRNA 2'-O-methyltransferase n=1 Tax=Halorubellus sp. PRR65 TaxID=3098148 RepID=UPI002B256843|nr:fibrillarin-like rRNA/tRNA 2'-O-methyltransferase [Halorubellus sp. PRR65]